MAQCLQARVVLLTGRLFDNSVNGLNTYIMPKNADRETVLDVTATFEVASELYVFTKQMKEKWTKKRGTDDVVYEGVDVTYYVNGVKKNTVKDFNKILYRVFGFENAITRIDNETKLLSKIDLIMLFSVLDFFITLDNKTLRELVLLVGGDVSIQDLEMSELLKNTLRKYDYSIDDLKKVIKLKLKGDRNNKGLNEVLSNLKSQQDGYKSQIVELDGSIEDTQKELKETNQQIISLNVEMQKGEEDLLRDIETKITQTEMKLSKRERELETLENPELEKASKDYDKELIELQSIEDELKTKQIELETLEQSTSFKENQYSGVKQRGQDL